MCCLVSHPKCRSCHLLLAGLLLLSLLWIHQSPHSVVLSHHRILCVFLLLLYKSWYVPSHIQPVFRDVSLHTYAGIASENLPKYFMIPKIPAVFSLGWWHFFSAFSLYGSGAIPCLEIILPKNGILVYPM